MPNTDTSICNSALVKVGVNRIISLDDDSPEGRICKEQYPKIKRKFLRGHLWNFATLRASLAQLTNVPAFGFSYFFQLPEDCLRVTGMSDEESYDWKIEGRYLATDNPAPSIRYISDVNESYFDDTAAEALAYALAVDICVSLSQSEGLKDSLDKDARQAMRDARTFDAQESVGDRVYADTWLNSRD